MYISSQGVHAFGLGEVSHDLTPEDIELIRAAKAKDSAAFARLVHNYQRFVYTTVFAVVRNQHDAEDISQDTFVKVYQFLKGLRDERTFPTWLARIAVRTAQDFLKRARRTEELPLDEHHQVVRPSPEGEGLAWDARIDLMQALQGLTQEMRTILVLREYHGFDYEELAQILDIPVGTVRSRLHNARLRLRQSLANERGDSK